MCSYKKDIKQIKQDDCSDARVMSQGWDLGAQVGAKGSIFFFQHGHVAYQMDGGDEQNRMQVNISPKGQGSNW